MTTFTVTNVYHHTKGDRKSTCLSFEPTRDSEGVWNLKEDKWFEGHLEIKVGDKVRL